MKILIIANGYPTPNEPQFGCFEKDQALALQQAGHEVNIMYVDGRFRWEKRKIGVNYFYKDGMNVYGIFWFPFLFLVFVSQKYKLKLKQKMLLQAYKRMEKQQGKPDIIYAHYLNNIACATVLKEKYNIPFVGIEHWSVINQPQLPEYVSFLGKTAYPKVDKLLAVSNSLSFSIKKHFGMETVVVHNMVGKEFLQVRNKNIGKDNASFNFLAIGSLLPRKGFDLLISAFSKIDLTKRKCKLVIIGAGNEYNRLQSQICQLSLQESIVLVGRKTKYEIISILQESNAFILSSHSETFSVVCIEAMAQGVPVIATACGGPEEFVTKEVGILVKPSDVDALANAMIEMYDNYLLYDNEKIAEYCRCKFAPEVIAQQLSSIFEEVVSKHKEK